MGELLKDFPLVKEEAARFLAGRGEVANRESARRFTELRERFPEAPLFSLAVAHWLAESFSHKPDEKFFLKVLSYMEREREPAGLGEYGQVPLFPEAAELWRIILITQDASGITDDFSATDIWLYQEIVLNAAGLLGVRKMPKGLGPWLFLGPFKLLIAWRPQYWSTLESEYILYPFGRVEAAALGFFRERGADWLGSNLERILKIDEQNFSTASATIAMAQDIQKELARTAGAHLLHINAGLRELGSVS